MLEAAFTQGLIIGVKIFKAAVGEVRIGNNEIELRRITTNLDRV